MMKRFFIVLLGLLPWLAKAQDIPPKPNPARFVNDYVNILSADQSADLEHRLKTLEDSSSNQVVVVIIASTKDYDPADYAFALGRKWGVGTKEFNNGAVLLIAKDDHKVFIATGYGLEGALPDATCKEIVDNDITPYFKKQDFYRGISNGIDDIIKATKGEYKPQKKKSFNNNNLLFKWLLPIFILLAFGMSLIGRRRGGGGTYYGGSSFGSWSSGGSSSFSSSSNSSSFGGGSFGGGGAGGSW